VAEDEQARPLIVQPRQTLELTEDECWQLLGGVGMGRVVFTMRAMPAIRPVNHLTDGKTIIIRSHLGSAITAHASGDGTVVCYEADDLDPVRHTGWSVIATGMARLVSDPAMVARYERLLEPWVDSQMDHVIAITPQTITGIRLPGWCR
jgi:nitroimidazol reductase NimA-like FMN-containing flavoprotein (pyridoxamine 5'-phosphate oxidase superfamily)